MDKTQEEATDASITLEWIMQLVHTKPGLRAQGKEAGRSIESSSWIN